MNEQEINELKPSRVQTPEKQIGLRFCSQKDGIFYYMLTNQLARVDKKLTELHDFAARNKYTDEVKQGIKYFGKEKALLLKWQCEILNDCSHIEV